ncbi:MAG: ABC transporter permease [Anaerolineae bacterium]|nr:ABC transporter permease [Anaerolineae bacterium]
MNKTLLVLRNELYTVFSRRTFLFTTFGLPLIAFLIFQVVARMNNNSPQVLSTLLSDPTQSEKQGFVDTGGFLVASDETGPQAFLVSYIDEAAALADLNAGEISAYYVIPEDFLDTGELYFISSDFNPLAASEASWVMKFSVLTSLLDGDVDTAQRINHPMNLEVKSLAPPEQQRDKSNMLFFWIPYATTLIFYIVILGSASLLLNSISNEKQNRVVEVLLLSVRPRQMLTGKIIGLGIAGLAQTILWVGTGYTLLTLSGRTYDLPENLHLPISIVAWGLVFFILGYAVYASLMAGLGALVPNLREATQSTIVVIFPLIIPMFFLAQLIEDPHSVFSISLSIFPFTAPVAMMTRLSAGGVPSWQPVLAAVLMSLTAWLVINAVARMFHAQNLLSGQSFSTRRFFKALFVGN